MLKGRKECNSYLTHICRHPCSGESLAKCKELSANTVGFISCKLTLSKGASRGKREDSTLISLSPLSNQHFGQSTSTADESHSVS